LDEGLYVSLAESSVTGKFVVVSAESLALKLDVGEALAEAASAVVDGAQLNTCRDDLTGHKRCLDDLLINGKSVLDDGALEDIALQDGLDLFNDSLSDDFIDNRCVDDLSAGSGVYLRARQDHVGSDGSTSFDDGLAALGRELTLFQDGGSDLSLVHHLSDLSDIELFALSVDNGLDLLLLHGVDVLVNDGILLDDLTDGGFRANKAERGSLSALDVGGLVDHRSFAHDDTRGGTSSEVVHVYTTIVVSVQRIVVYALVHGKALLVHDEALLVHAWTSGEVVHVYTTIVVSVKRVLVSEGLSVGLERV